MLSTNVGSVHGRMSRPRKKVKDMTKNINTKLEFKDYLKSKGIFHLWDYYNKKCGVTSLTELQKIVSEIKLDILCNDLSMAYTVLDEQNVRIDDMRFCNASYALFSLMQSLPLDYLQSHNYLYYDDCDLTEQLREETKHNA